MTIIRYGLLFTFLMVASNAYGQQISSNKTQNNIQVGLFYSYDQNLSGNNINFSSESGFYNDYGQLNFTAGLTVTYFLNNKFALHSGISYANRNFSGIYYCHTCEFTTPGPQKRKLSLQFVQIPVAIRIYPYKGKFSIFGELGIINQIMFNKPSTNFLHGKTYSLSGVVGVGTAYNFSSAFSVQLSVKYTNGLSDIFQDTDYSYRIWGVQLAIIRKL